MLLNGDQPCNRRHLKVPILGSPGQEGGSGATPEPTRETRALPGLKPGKRAIQHVEEEIRIGLCNAHWRGKTDGLAL